ncbi:hypothetical protein [Psychrobacter sp. SZ93C1]|uniref:hypothetical protein n=1 Tax=Psychrobacter sp. SZ93C1 TaxID=2792058 RepID=UPI0018CE962A|nr:hypothetical protein [Psychrobacter sp. SZ93C1]MBH0063697.1 hypothetical protein [Psychrobacter sp. SZ93C1]
MLQVPIESEDVEASMTKILKLETNIASSEFYISSLAIGILEGMKSGTVSFEEGIWSLGRPAFWNSFDKTNFLSDELLNCVKNFDEIDAMETISNKESALKTINELLSILHICQKNSLLNSPDLKLSSSIN